MRLSAPNTWLATYPLRRITIRRNLQWRIGAEGFQLSHSSEMNEGLRPKSYGTNVAKLVGLPNEVVEMAADLAEDIGKERRGDLICLKSMLARMQSWRASGGDLHGQDWNETMESLKKLKQVKNG